MSKVNIFITVDTEHSIGGAFSNPRLKPVGNEKRIFGRIGDKAYGIPLIMDIADACNIPLTFFVEVLNKHYFGEAESREVCRYIIDRGHDVQLHLHPNYLNFTQSEPGKLHFPGNMFCYQLEKQIELIKQGKELLARYGVGHPVAFRAGNFGADMNTLTALKVNDFFVDSSYNKYYLGNNCKLGDLKINDACKVGSVWEFPITNFREFPLWNHDRTRPLDINGVSFYEMQNVLEQATNCRLKNITILLHSFSFIKPKDAQYNKAKPRWRIIKRFKQLCEHLHSHSDIYRVRTFGSLTKEELENINESASDNFPPVPSVFSLIRAREQIWDNLFL